MKSIISRMAVRCNGAPLMSWLRARNAFRYGLLVVSLTCLVQWLAPGHILMAQPSAEAPQQLGCTADGRPPPPLPSPVEEMREAILSAVRSGDIEDLRPALEWNELKPHIGGEASDDPIAQWKKMSTDGAGREILAVLADILECGYTTLPIGSDIENNLVFVWPGLAEADLSKLSPLQEVWLYRLVSAPEAKAMVESKRWQWWRLAIGADGTWHTFHKAE